MGSKLQYKECGRTRALTEGWRKHIIGYKCILGIYIYIYILRNGLIYKRNKAIQSASNKHKDLEKTANKRSRVQFFAYTKN